MTPHPPTAAGRHQRPQRGTPSPPRDPGQAPDSRIPHLKVRIGSPTSLLAVIPVLLGFDPGHSIVVIGTEPGTSRVLVALRYDLPDPAQPALGAALARHAVSVLAAQGVVRAAAVGYGLEAEVEPVVAALRRRAALAGISLTELLRAENQRYWSYVCADPGCCPPEGTPFDVSGHPTVLALRAAGGHVLAGREALAAMVAPAGGRTGAVLRRATKESLGQFARCLRRLERADLGVSATALVAALGQVVVRDAIRRYRAGERLPLEHAALLTVALGQVRVRDDAWSRMDPAYRDAHLRLWTDLTRLARPGYVAAPAALLAFCAWQDGDGALGNVALDRALADNPHYSMALLLREALDSGAPPSMARLPMTPEEVTAAYDAVEDGPANAEPDSAANTGAEATGDAAATGSGRRCR